MTTPNPSPRPRRYGRLALRWLIFLGIVYIGVVIVLWFLEHRLVFRPATAEQSWNAPIVQGTQDITFNLDDGTSIHAWWLPPKDPAAGAVLIAHGNGGNISHRGQLAADLNLTLGAGVLMFDYPGYGKSTGRPTEASCYAAGEAAYKWLIDTAKVPANRIVLLGESLGSGPAVELATRHEHRALVLVFPFTSLPDAAKHHYPWLPVHMLMRTRFDNLAKIGQCPRPVFVAHGTADDIVPFSLGQALYEAANKPKEFMEVPGAGHELSLIGPLLCEPLAKFLADCAP